MLPCLMEASPSSLQHYRHLYKYTPSTFVDFCLLLLLSPVSASENSLFRCCVHLQPGAGAASSEGLVPPPPQEMNRGPVDGARLMGARWDKLLAGAFTCCRTKGELQPSGPSVDRRGTSSVVRALVCVLGSRICVSKCGEWTRLCVF